MRTLGRVFGRTVALLLVAGVFLGAAAASATAGVEHYCAGDWPAKWACSGSTGHNNQTIYVEIVTNHTGCADIASYPYGGGSWYNPDLNYWDDWACTAGSGTNGGYAAVSGGTVYGGIRNPNASTTDHVSDAHVSW
jgi:hypothetical protein